MTINNYKIERVDLRLIGESLVLAGIAAYLVLWWPDWMTMLHWKTSILLITTILALLTISIDYKYYYHLINRPVILVGIFLVLCAISSFLLTGSSAGLIGEHPQHIGLLTLLAPIPIALVLSPVLRRSKQIFFFCTALGFISILLSLVNMDSVRLIGVGMNPNTTAIIMMIGLIYGWGVRKMVKPNVLLLGSAVLIGTIILSQSRLGIAMAIVFLIYTAFQTKKVHIQLVGMLGAVGVVILSPRFGVINYAFESIKYRAELFLAGATLISRELMGLGVGGISENMKLVLPANSLVLTTTPEYLIIDSTHNHFLDIGIEWGALLGVALFVTSILLIGLIIANLRTIKPHDRPIVTSFITLFIFVCVNNTTVISWLLYASFFIAAIIAVQDKSNVKVDEGVPA